jgi:NADH-quinone oxidoreductase E subunit
MLNEIEELLQKYSHASRDSLIPILQEIQDKMGFLSEEAIVLVGKHLGIPTSSIYGLATFYNQFRFSPKGKYHIQLCHGTSCHLMGATSIIDLIAKKLKIKSGQTSSNGLFSLEIIPCMGACAYSPLISVNGKHHAKITENRLLELLEELKESQEV